VNPDAAVLALGLDQKSIKTGEPVDWNSILDVQGGYTADSQAYFKQATGYDLVGTFAVNSVDPSVVVVTFDQDTIPQNTSIASTVNGIDARGTVDAIIDPYKYNPVTTYGSRTAIPLGIRFLMLDDVNNSENVGQSYGVSPFTNNYDGPDAWKNSDGNDPVIKANSIIEWNGSAWVLFGILLQVLILHIYKIYAPASNIVGTATNGSKHLKASMRQDIGALF
jgi:hypothetical protein